MTWRLPVLLVACLAVGACATLTRRTDHGGLQIVTLTWLPDRARVLVDGRDVGVTPTRIPLPEEPHEVVVRFEKDGYEALQVPIQRRLSAALAGDIALGLIALNPLIGLGDFDSGLPKRSTRAAIGITVPAAALLIDFGSGAARKFPSSVHVTLTPRRQ